MGISRYNSEGYADPTAYEAIRSIETFRVDHPNGYIEVNLETFFPCTHTKAKKHGGGHEHGRVPGRAAA